MAENKNALVELTRRFDGLYNDIYCNVGHEEAEDYLKALRIVAELAKVRISREGRPNITDLLNLFYEFRAIAEE